MIVLRVLAAAILLVASGCLSPPEPPAGSAPPAAPVPGAPSMDAAEARARLATLRVVDRGAAGLPPYRRDAFGSAWADVDGNGCNQRDDVLMRDALPGTVRVQPQGTCPHDVIAGSWIDPYSGRTLVFDDLKDPRQARAIQIDHVVPLAEAWVSGASGWPAERRRAFANDPIGLLAVDGPTNASKGHADPAAWRPRKRRQCGYATRWITIKARWDLGADASEARALAEMLDRCTAAPTG